MSWTETRHVRVRRVWYDYRRRNVAARATRKTRGIRGTRGGKRQMRFSDDRRRPIRKFHNRAPPFSRWPDAATRAIPRRAGIRRVARRLNTDEIITEKKTRTVYRFVVDIDMVFFFFFTILYTRQTIPARSIIMLCVFTGLTAWPLKAIRIYYVIRIGKQEKIR